VHAGEGRGAFVHQGSNGSSLISRLRACLSEPVMGGLPREGLWANRAMFPRGLLFCCSCEVLALDGVLPPVPVVRAVTENSDLLVVGAGSTEGDMVE
jgi:hypothetical protein